MTVQYNRSLAPIQADFCEKMGNALLMPMRLACGRFVKVNNDLRTLEEEKVHLVTRITMGILILLIFPQKIG